MELVSYEPYHIGIKLTQFINLNLLKDKLKILLEEKKFELMRGPQFGSVSIESPKEILGEKKDVKVELNRVGMALNVIGYSKKDTMGIHNEIMEVFDKMGYDIKFVIKFYEIIANIIVATKEKTEKIMNNCLKVKLPKPVDYLDALTTHGLRFRTAKPDDEDEFFDIVLEPSATSPEYKFFCRLLFRTKNRNNLIIIDEHLEGKIKEFFAGIGAK